MVANVIVVSVPALTIFDPSNAYYTLYTLGAYTLKQIGWNNQHIDQI